MRQRYGVSPHSTELAFGTVSHKSENAETAPHVEWSHPDVGTLRFRGIVDRIDVSPSGKTALVIDYKTGGAGVYDAMKKDPVDRGRRLQLPVYGLAARQHVGTDVKVFVAYWFISTRGGFVMRPDPPVALDELLEGFSKTVQTITAGIAEGLFPAHPGNPERTPPRTAHTAISTSFVPRNGRGRGIGSGSAAILDCARTFRWPTATRSRKTMTDAPLPADQPARDAIVERLGENMVVEAGAGTGKTRSLVDRVVALVATGARRWTVSPPSPLPKPRPPS